MSDGRNGNFLKTESHVINEVLRRSAPPPKSKARGPSGHIRVWHSPKIPDDPFPVESRIWVNPKRFQR